MTDSSMYPCPCCGYLVFGERPGSYDICEICGWEDDLSQLRFPTMGGANPPLVECQQQFQARVEPERPERPRDPQWRPLDLGPDEVEVPVPGREYGATYRPDSTSYYYWRQ